MKHITLNNRGGRKYRKMLNRLDQVDMVVCINRTGPKSYDLIINGEIVKSFRQRRSCNRRIEKLYKSKIKSLT